MKKWLFVLGLMSLMSFKAEAATVDNIAMGTALTLSSTTATGLGATVTITTPTAAGSFSTGGYNYLTHLHIEAHYTGGVAGASTPITCTTTNTPGTFSLKFPPAVSTGTVAVTDISFSNPIQSTTAATNTTVVCPATTNVLWNVIVGYMQK